MQPLGATPIHGYARSEVDDFLNAAAQERARLEATIADANTRAGRARSALGTHRVMVAMLLETQRELGQLRIDAETQAEMIIAEAEREVALARAERRDPQEIDLSSFAVTQSPTMADATGAGSPFFAAPASPVGEPRMGTTTNAAEDGNDEYFAFLRGALDDDQPLGPSPGA